MAVSWARRLLQQRQLRDKNFRGISRELWKLTLYFKIYVCVCGVCGVCVVCVMMCVCGVCVCVRVVRVCVCVWCVCVVCVCGVCACVWCVCMCGVCVCGVCVCVVCGYVCIVCVVCVCVPPLLAKFCRTMTFRDNLIAKPWDTLTKLAIPQLADKPRKVWKTKQTTMRISWN